MTMADSMLQEFYRTAVLEHSRHPHRFGKLPDADREARGFNPLCGDKLTVYLKLADDRIIDAQFEGTGCAISVASASMMADALAGRPLAEAERIIEQVEALFTGDAELTDPRLSELHALAGVRSYPSRVKCATLAWRTAQAALAGQQQQISTEQDN